MNQVGIELFLGFWADFGLVKKSCLLVDFWRLGWRE